MKKSAFVHIVTPTPAGEADKLVIWGEDRRQVSLARTAEGIINAELSEHKHPLGGLTYQLKAEINPLYDSADVIGEILAVAGVKLDAALEVDSKPEEAPKGGSKTK